jgi:hypothetical protein
MDESKSFMHYKQSQKTTTRKEPERQQTSKTVWDRREREREREREKAWGRD